jgi:hypothetical protein
MRLNPLSHHGRGKLIEAWMRLESSDSQEVFDRRVERTEQLINTVIGKNTLPSSPFVVLALLQALDQKETFSLENGSFGYLYEVLITSSLGMSLTSNQQLERKYSFLPRLAYFMSTKRAESISATKLDELMDAYSNELLVNLDKKQMLDDLVYAHVLLRTDGNYRFTHSHFLQYFLALYFSEHIYTDKGAGLREELIQYSWRMDNSANRTFLLFVLYLTRDEKLTAHLVTMADQLLAEIQPSRFGDEITFFDDVPEGSLPQKEAPEAVDLGEQREKRRLAVDQAHRIEDEPIDTLPQVGAREDLARTNNDRRFKLSSGCLQVLGQALRNFAGTMERERKLAILKSTYLLGLRITGGILSDIEGAAKRVRDARDPKVTEEALTRFDGLVRKFAILLGAMMIRTVSLTVGTTDVKELAYSTTLQAVGRTPATELIDLAIKLDHRDEYPLTEVSDLKRDFNKNPFADQVLQVLVIENMFIFPMEREMRARVAAALKIKLKPSERLISDKGKRFESS